MRGCRRRETYLLAGVPARVLHGGAAPVHGAVYLLVNSRAGRAVSVYRSWFGRMNGVMRDSGRVMYSTKGGKRAYLCASVEKLLPELKVRRPNLRRGLLVSLVPAKPRGARSVVLRVSRVRSGDSVRTRANTLGVFNTSEWRIKKSSFALTTWIRRRPCRARRST